MRAAGVARSLDPMPSADRKIIHDALAAIDGVTSRSEGEDPNRRVVVAPAADDRVRAIRRCWTALTPASQRLGMLGPRPLAEVVEHAGAFVAALGRRRAARVVDLGSGGGVPGLVIARARPDLRLVLVDRRATRTDHLRRLVGRLGLADRVDVRDGRRRRRRRPLLEAPADAVVARGFADPATTARDWPLALLAPGGLLVVSEPPEPAPDRWPDGRCVDRRRRRPLADAGPPRGAACGSAMFHVEHRAARRSTNVPRGTSRVLDPPPPGASGSRLSDGAPRSSCPR